MLFKTSDNSNNFKVPINLAPKDLVIKRSSNYIKKTPATRSDDFFYGKIKT